MNPQISCPHTAHSLCGELDRQVTRPFTHGRVISAEISCQDSGSRTFRWHRLAYKSSLFGVGGTVLEGKKDRCSHWMTGKNVADRTLWRPRLTSYGVRTSPSSVTYKELSVEE